jgi:16S rRNA (cytidine1402-2'-O)-methyltransferase
MGDITLRALETLRSVDVVAAEDTRRTGLLLKQFDIHKPQISFREHQEERAGARILTLLEEDKSVALVTDAGTPGIADPGFRLVRAAIERGITMTAIPGPSAILPALVLSGLAVHSFTFRGFPPRRSGQRQSFFSVDRDSPHTLIYYESPYRLIACLQDALVVFGDRPASVVNDLTKKFEEVRRGSITSLLADLSQVRLRGEYVVVIAGAQPDGKQNHEHDTT